MATSQELKTQKYLPIFLCRLPATPREKPSLLSYYFPARDDSLPGMIGTFNNGDAEKENIKSFPQAGDLAYKALSKRL